MKRHLIFCAAAALAVASAANPAASTQEQQKVVVPTHPVSTRTAQPSQQPAPVKHLTDDQRAELRRQLKQFNSKYGKRP